MQDLIVRYDRVTIFIATTGEHVRLLVPLTNVLVHRDTMETIVNRIHVITSNVTMVVRVLLMDHLTLVTVYLDMKEYFVK